MQKRDLGGIIFKSDEMNEVSWDKVGSKQEIEKEQIVRKQENWVQWGFLKTKKRKCLKNGELVSGPLK